MGFEFSDLGFMTTDLDQLAQGHKTYAFLHTLSLSLSLSLLFCFVSLLIFFFFLRLFCADLHGLTCMRTQ